MNAFAPTSARERIVALDALRGFALFGVLLVNLPFMALPTSEAFRTPDTETDSLANILAWALERAFFETKFFTIFSFLFGMGLILQMQRAEVSGRPFKGLYLRRLGWLGLLGLLHGTLLFMGDILLPYACVGLLLFLCRRMRPRNLVIVGLIPLAIWYLKVKGSTLIVTNVRSTYRTGILAKKTNEVRHKDVRNIQVKQSALQRIFNVGTVAISSAGQSNVEILATGIPGPGKGAGSGCV